MDEELKEAVKMNIGYLENPQDVAIFLEAVAESVYDSDLLEQLAETIRDVEEGV